MIQIHGRLMLPDMQRSLRKPDDPNVKLFASVFVDNLATIENVYLGYMEIYYRLKYF
jgi:hypothetical protein